MFRIDRRLVKISVPKVRSIPKAPAEEAETPPAKEAEEIVEVGVEGVSPDAAASTEDVVKSLMADAEQEMEDELQRMIEEAKAEAARLVESEKGKADGLIDDAYNEAEKLLNEADAKLEEAEKKLEEAKKAEKQAEKILEDAQSQAVDIKKSAYDEGFIEGKQAGEREGLQIYEDKLEQEKQALEAELKNVLDEFAQERQRVNSETEADTVSLAVEVVRKIFAPAEKELGNVFTLLIKNALRQMSVENKVILRVSPSEYERYFSTGEGEIKLDSGTIVTATVLRDAALEEGDLIIDTDDMTVNAGLNSQLRYVELAFSEIRREDAE